MAFLPREERLHHPRRCQAKTKKPCMLYAVTGSKYCHHHGGKPSKRDGVRIEHLPMFYSKHLTGTLKEYVDQAMAGSPEAQLNLFEELALIRHTLGEGLKLYDLAQRSEKDETRMAAATMLREQLSEVGEFAERAARVEAAMRDKVSVHSIQYVVNQLIRIMFDVCEKHDCKHVAEDFQELVREKVKVSGSTSGTTLEPSRDALDMDDTVPSA